MTIISLSPSVNNLNNNPIQARSDPSGPSVGLLEKFLLKCRSHSSKDSVDPVTASRKWSIDHISKATYLVIVQIYIEQNGDWSGWHGSTAIFCMIRLGFLVISNGLVRLYFRGGGKERAEVGYYTS